MGSHLLCDCSVESMIHPSPQLALDFETDDVTYEPTKRVGKGSLHYSEASRESRAVTQVTPVAPVKGEASGICLWLRAGLGWRFPPVGQASVVWTSPPAPEGSGLRFCSPFTQIWGKGGGKREVELKSSQWPDIKNGVRYFILPPINVRNVQTCREVLWVYLSQNWWQLSTSKISNASENNSFVVPSLHFKLRTTQREDYMKVGERKIRIGLWDSCGDMFS